MMSIILCHSSRSMTLSFCCRKIEACWCYGRTLAPNITDLSFHFLLSFLSYLLSWLIRSPLVPWQLRCLRTRPTPALHLVQYTISISHSVLCTSMLLSFIYHMPHVILSLFIKAVPSLWQCLMHIPYACFLFFSSILPPPCGCIMSFFHSMAMLDACLLLMLLTYLVYVRTRIGRFGTIMYKPLSSI